METPNTRSAIELAVMTEELGARCYEALAERFASDDELRDTFLRLAADEHAHEAMFSALLLQAPREEEVDPELLRAAAVAQFLRPQRMDAFLRVKSAVEALAHAIELEEATLLYYESVQTVLGSSPQVQALIDAERQHVATLMRLLLDRRERYRHRPPEHASQ